MAEQETQPIPEVHAAEIRRLMHDLGNALEIIVQTQYLLKMGQLDDSAQQWLAMMDTGVKKATEINAGLRKYMVENAPGEGRIAL